MTSTHTVRGDKLNELGNRNARPGTHYTPREGREEGYPRNSLYNWNSGGLGAGHEQTAMLRPAQQTERSEE